MRNRKRNDIAWLYCTMVDNNVGHVCCNFCGHVMWGGVTRLKHHLAGIKGNVIPCRSCPRDVTAKIQEYLGHRSRKNDENIEGHSEQVNDMRGSGNEEELRQEKEYWKKLVGEIEEFLTSDWPMNEENIDSGSKQVNGMRGGGNEEQFQTEQKDWQKFLGGIEEKHPHCSQKNEANIDGVSEQVNDMRGEEQLQLNPECWQRNVADDMFGYFCEGTFDHGWEARNLEYEMELKQKNGENDHALKAALRESKLTFWEDRIRRGEGCSGTKPVPSFQEYSLTDDDSDDNSELGF